MSDLGDLASAVLLLVLLLAASAACHFVLPRLPEHHRSRETLDVARLVSSLIITFAALVLGLLIASVNTAFFNAGSDMNALAGSATRVDSCLRALGTEADPLRADLRRYVAGVLASTWPEERAPSGDSPTVDATGAGLESRELGDILDHVQIGLLRLDPPDPLLGRMETLCSNSLSMLLDYRWKLIEEARSTISVPLYRVLALMLVTVFACFGLSTPRNSLSWLIVGLAAFTIAASVFVVLELDGPFSGLVKISSASMRAALAHLDR